MNNSYYLSNTYHVPGIVLRALHMISHTPPQNPELGFIIIPLYK